MPRRVVNTTERDRDMPVSPYGAYENPSKQACLQGMDASGKGPVGFYHQLSILQSCCDSEVMCKTCPNTGKSRKDGLWQRCVWVP